MNYYKSVRKHAELALGALYGQQPLSDERFPVSAYRATQYRFLDRARATYDELVSTGTIGLIDDDALRRSALTSFTTVVYDVISTKARESEFRALFRESVSYEVQNALLQRCGDRDPKVLDYAAIANMIDYDCTLDLPAQNIAKAAAALRAQARLLPALQLRQADLGTAVNDLVVDQRDRGLAE